MSHNGKKRLFLALNLPTEVKKEVGALIDSLEKQTRHVRWVRPEGLHLTLHFLGELPDDKIEAVRSAIEQAPINFPPLEFSFGEIGAFPDLYRPRVVYLACSQTNGRTVFELVKILGELLVEQGIGIDRRIWKPHITLGRARESRNNEQIDFKGLKVISSKFSRERDPASRWQVTSFELMESELKPDGAVYKAVASFKL